MKLKGIINRLSFLAIAVFIAAAVNVSAQTLVVNYDFASATAGTP
jgi:hypothetical protein